MVDRPEKIWGI